MGNPINSFIFHIVYCFTLYESRKPLATYEQTRVSATQILPARETYYETYIVFVFCMEF